MSIRVIASRECLQTSPTGVERAKETPLAVDRLLFDLDSARISLFLLSEGRRRRSGGFWWGRNLMFTLQLLFLPRRSGGPGRSGSSSGVEKKGNSTVGKM